MLKKEILISLLSVLLLSGCSAFIYAIRGPKYKGKFKSENYLSSLEGQYFHFHYDYSENVDDTIRIQGNDTIKIIRNYAKHHYIFLRYDNDGKIKVKSVKQDSLLEHLPSKSELDELPISNEIYYVIKDSLIKYEIYTDSYNGYNLYKARFYGDSIVDWQIGISKLYLKTYKKIIN